MSYPAQGFGVPTALSPGSPVFFHSAMTPQVLHPRMGSPAPQPPIGNDGLHQPLTPQPLHPPLQPQPASFTPSPNHGGLRESPAEAPSSGGLKKLPSAAELFSTSTFPQQGLHNVMQAQKRGSVIFQGSAPNPLFTSASNVSLTQPLAQPFQPTQHLQHQLQAQQLQAQQLQAQQLQAQQLQAQQLQAQQLQAQQLQAQQLQAQQLQAQQLQAQQQQQLQQLQLQQQFQTQQLHQALLQQRQQNASPLGVAAPDSPLHGRPATGPFQAQAQTPEPVVQPLPTHPLSPILAANLLVSPPGSQGSTPMTFPNPFFVPLEEKPSSPNPQEELAKREAEKVEEIEKRKRDEKEAYLLAQRAYLENIRKEHEERLQKERELEEQRKREEQERLWREKKAQVKAEKQRLAEENRKRMEMLAEMERQEKMILEERRRIEEEQRRKFQEEAEAREKLRQEQERMIQEQIRLQQHLMEQERIRYEQYLQEEQRRQQMILLQEKARLDEQLRIQKELLEKAQLEAEAEELRKQQEVLEQEKKRLEEERLKKEALKQEALQYEKERLLYQQRKLELEEFERKRQEALKKEQEEMERQIQLQREQMKMVEENMRKERERFLEEQRKAALLLQQQENKVKEESKQLKVEKHMTRSGEGFATHPPLATDSNPFGDTEPFAPDFSAAPPLNAQQRSPSPGYHQPERIQPLQPPPASGSPALKKRTSRPDGLSATGKPGSPRTRKTSFDHRPETAGAHTMKAKRSEEERSSEDEYVKRAATPPKKESPPSQAESVKKLPVPVPPLKGTDASGDDYDLGDLVERAKIKKVKEKAPVLEEEKSSRTLVMDSILTSPMDETYEQLIKRTDGKNYPCRMYMSAEWNKRGANFKVILQVYIDGIIILEKKKKRIVEKYRINQIRRYVTQKKFVLIDCGSHRDGHIVLESKAGPEIVKLLDSNIQEISKALAKQRKDQPSRPQPPPQHLMPQSPRTAPTAPESKDKDMEQVQKKELERKQEEEKERQRREKEKSEAESPSPPVTVTPAPNRTIDLSDVPSGRRKKLKKKGRSLNKLKRKKSKPEEMTLSRVGHSDEATSGLRIKDKPYFIIWLPNHDSSQPENIYKITKKRRQFTMGLSSTNDLILADPHVGQQQASVKEVDGVLVLTDLNPLDPTKVDGAPATAPVKLQPGSILSMGQTKIVVCNKKINAPIKKLDEVPKSFIKPDSPKVPVVSTTPQAQPVPVPTHMGSEAAVPGLPPRPTQPPPLPEQTSFTASTFTPPPLPPRTKTPSPPNSTGMAPPPRPHEPAPAVPPVFGNTSYNPFEAHAAPPVPFRAHATEKHSSDHSEPSRAPPVLLPPPELPVPPPIGMKSQTPSPPSTFAAEPPPINRKTKPPRPAPIYGDSSSGMVDDHEIDSLAAALRDLKEDNEPQQYNNPFAEAQDSYDTNTTTTTVHEAELDSLAAALRELGPSETSSPPTSVAPPVYQPPITRPRQNTATLPFAEEIAEAEEGQYSTSPPAKRFVPPAKPPPRPPGYGGN